MKKRRSRFLTALLAVTLVLPSGIMAADNSQVAAANQNLQKAAAEKAKLLTETYGITSVQYALIDHGQITVSGQAGVNDIEGKIPLTKDTMYGIGSTSKVFTAAAVMKLVDEGKINLDTPLVQYLPEFKMKDERYTKITPRMLLNHSSGLHGSSLNNAFLFEDHDSHAHDTLLKQLSTQSLKAEPGAFSVYNNDGFTLAEILVEKVSGKDFTAFIHQNITAPLDMEHTKTSQETLQSSQMAGLYFPTYQGQLPNETTNVIGTGGIYSTAEDLVQFAQIFTGEAKGILSDQSVKAMEQAEYKKGLWPEDADNSFDYGLGWDSVRLYPFNQYDMKALTKGGDTILYHASLVVLPEHNMAAAVLSSGGSSSINQLFASDMLLNALKEKGEIKEIKPDQSFGKPVKADMPKDIEQFAGYYVSTNQQMKVDIKDGDLSITVPMVPEYPAEKYVYTADGTFVSPDGSVKVSFVKESNDRIYVWVRQYISIPGLGQLALSHYTAEKLEANPLSKDIAAAWNKREGETFYPLNEKYTSLVYLITRPTVEINSKSGIEGYMIDKKIIDSDNAVSQHQIPAMGGRDTSEFHFYKEKGVEYLEAAGSLFISGKNVKPLYKGKKSNVTIGADGYAKWYTIPKQAAGKTMTVTLPAQGAFVVYDEAGTAVNYSLISGSNEVKLPANGAVVFAGAPGSAFNITLK